jgi:hypothetical protein
MANQKVPPAFPIVMLVIYCYQIILRVFWNRGFDCRIWLIPLMSGWNCKITLLAPWFIIGLLVRVVADDC